MKSRLTEKRIQGIRSNMSNNLTWVDRKKLAHVELQKIDWRRVVSLSLFFFLGGLTYALYIVPTLGWRIPCPLYELFGIVDAGEGLTSAIYQTLHGNFYQAFRLNAMLYIATPLFALWYILKLFYFKRLALLTLVVVFTITTLYGILRNFEQFSYLLPTWLG